MFLKSCIFKNVHAFIQPMGEESRRGGGGGEITESDRIFKCRDRYRLNQII